MRPRFLGIAFVVLAVLGVLNLYQAVRARIAPSVDYYTVDATDEARGDRTVQSADGALKRSFKVSDGGLLDIRVEHSDIIVRTSRSDRAEVTIRVNARSEDAKAEIIDGMNFEITEEDDRIIVRSDKDRQLRFRHGSSIDIDVRIPVRFNVDLVSTHGDVAMETVEGDVSVTTTHGDVALADIDGPNVRIVSTHGDVVAGAMHARSMQIVTTHGDIVMASADVTELEAATTHSDVVVGRLSGATRIATTHGDVTVGIEGESPLQIRTTHGDVDILLQEEIAADLELRGERVMLPSGLSFEGTLKKKEAHGTLNGGGSDIVVTTSFGDVTVRKN
jgi:DUF4097 and DUF4098 domain-containing protein YvlB